MKDLGKTKFFLGLQLEQLHTDILVHQSADAQKILEKFNMDKAYLSKNSHDHKSLRNRNHFGHTKKEKRYWALNTHTLVPLEH
jgi:hypothetical protein